MKKKLQTAFLTRQYMLEKDFEIYYYNDTVFSNVGKHSHTHYEFFFSGGGCFHVHRQCPPSAEIRGCHIDSPSISLTQIYHEAEILSI